MVSHNGRAAGNFATSGRSGSQSASWIQAAPSHTYTFYLHDYSGGSLGSRLDSVRVTGKAPPRPKAPTIGSFSASPSSIDKGKSSTLKWSTSNATSVFISPGIGKVSTSGSRTVSPSKTTTYTLTATNSTKSVKATARVTVRPPSTVSGRISASPNPCTIAAGKRTCTTTLTWSATGTTGLLVRVSRNSRPATVLASSGRSGSASPSWIQAAPANTYTFYLYNYAGRVQGKLLDSVKVTGKAPPKPAPKISSFTATPATIDKGESSTLSWSVTNADSLSIDQGIGTVTGTSVKVSPSLVTTYTLTATNSTGSAKARATVTVGVSLAPKIISFTASPATIDPGGSSTLKWSVSRNTASVSIDQNIGTVTGTSRKVSPSATKTYTLTATNSFRSVTATVTVTVRGSPKINRFRSSPVIIDPGGSSTLSWSTTGADSLSIDQGIGTVTGTSVKVSPSVTTMYTLTATNLVGSVKARATVQVRGPPKVSRFSASPKTIAPGGRATLSWSVTGADSLSIDQGVGTVTGTSVKVSLSATTTYTLTATNSLGSVTATAKVTVRGPPKISRFTATPTTIAKGGRATLSWSVANADRLFIDQGVGTVTGTSYSVSPSVTTTYKLTATNSVGLDTETVTVTVRGSPKIISFTATPATIEKGESSTLSWSVTNADSLSIDQGIGTVTGTSVKVSPSLVTTYTLTATNSLGSVKARATVTVGVSLAPKINFFTATPATIGKGKSSTLSWSTINADTLSIDQGIGTVAGTSVKVSPSATKTYTLTAANALKSVTATVKVTVRKPSTASGTISASPNPCTIAEGRSTCTSTIRWTIQNTTMARMFYSHNGARERHFTLVRGDGSRPVPWIKGPPNEYVFSLYDYTGGVRGALLASVTVTGTGAPPASGTISASPNPCTIAEGRSTCTSTIRWTIQNTTMARMFYSHNGARERHFTLVRGDGSRPVPWIKGPPNEYVFSLYDYTGGVRGALLASVTVTGTRAPAVSGKISVSPDPCTIYHGQTGCTPTVTWESKGATSVQVWYSLNGGEEQSLASSDGGGPYSKKLDVELRENDSIAFKLYDYSSGTREALLAELPKESVTIQTDIGCPPAAN